MKPTSRRTMVTKRTRSPSSRRGDAFAVVVALIEEARNRAYQSVNKELVGLYWRVGQYISRKLAAADWDDGVVDQLALHLAKNAGTSRIHPPESVSNASVL